MIGVKVKPLAWDGSEEDCYITADTPIGTYELIVADTLEPPHLYEWAAAVDLCNPRARKRIQTPQNASFEAAKAAAQADYEARILSALESVE